MAEAVNHIECVFLDWCPIAERFQLTNTLTSEKVRLPLGQWCIEYDPSSGSSAVFDKEQTEGNDDAPIKMVDDLFKRSVFRHSSCSCRQATDLLRAWMWRERASRRPRSWYAQGAHTRPTT